MTTLSIHEKKNEILTHEGAIARRLARRVFDKPIPPVWMILIPIFFVFHAWKIKQYGNGLKDFAENYMILRRQILDAAFESQHGSDVPVIDKLKQTIDSIPPKARDCFTELTTILADHFTSLLTARGNNYQALVREHYRNKTNYLLFCNQLNKVENSYNLALLPQIEGDNQDLVHVIKKMELGISELRKLQADEIFS